MANMSRYEREIMVHLEDGQHWIADDLYKILKKDYFLLGRGTIYRNLESLYKKGLIEKHYGLGDAIIREIKKDPHCHIYCDQSEKILDIQPIDVNIQDIKLPKGFKINTISVVIHGTFGDQICSVRQES